jgi:hypothetical protein
MVRYGLPALPLEDIGLLVIENVDNLICPAEFKLDLPPHLEFDLRQVFKNLDVVNPGVKRIPLSARTGEGVEEWCSWLMSRGGAPRRRYPDKAMYILVQVRSHHKYMVSWLCSGRLPGMLTIVTVTARLLPRQEGATIP